jgi:MFS family permease
VFVIVGSPGLLIAALALTLREPARQDLPPAREAGHSAHSADVPLLTYARANAAAIALPQLAQGVIAFASYSLMGWAPSVLMREFHQSRGGVGVTLGLLSLAGGVGGALAGALFCDRWTAAGATAAKLRVSAVGAAACAVGLVLLALADTAWAAFAAIALCSTALPFAAASGQAMVQELFPNRLRGQGSAIMVLSIGLFGAGCGPLVVGLLNDHVFHSQGLSTAIVTTGLPATAVVILIYWYGRQRYEALRQRLLNGGSLAGAPITAQPRLA